MIGFFYHFNFLDYGAFNKIFVILKIKTKANNREGYAEHSNHLFHPFSGKTEAQSHNV